MVPEGRPLGLSDDGTLESWISGGSNPGTVIYEPALVHDDWIVFTGNIAGEMVEVMLFTTSGDVKIIRTMVTW